MTTGTALRAPLLHALAGEIDLARAGAVCAEIKALVVSAPTVLRLDLSGVTFLDCAGLSALETSVAWGERHQVPVELIAPSRAVSRVLTLLAGRATLAPAC